METEFKGYQITDIPEKADPEKVNRLLAQSYWAAERDLETIQKSIENSLCLSIYLDNELIGFVRAVTDYATFAWIADLIIDEKHRGQGLGKKLMEILEEHPELPQHIRILATRDAHGLYEKFGYRRWEGMRKNG